MMIKLTFFASLWELSVCLSFSLSLLVSLLVYFNKATLIYALESNCSL